MRLRWERRYRWTPPRKDETQYWALTRKAGSTTGINTGYLVAMSRLHDNKFIASLPDGSFRVFATEDEAKDYCEVCCRMELHNGPHKESR